MIHRKMLNISGMIFNLANVLPAAIKALKYRRGYRFFQKNVDVVYCFLNLICRKEARNYDHPPETTFLHNFSLLLSQMTCRISASFVGVLLFLGQSQAQDLDTSFSIADIVYMDSVVVKASREGFSIEDFAQIVQTDTTFYHAFENLRKLPYHLDTDMTFSDKKSKASARYTAKHRQIIRGSCRSMHALEENWEGNMKRRRKDAFRFYTAEMYDRLFLYEGEICSVQDSPSEQGKSSTSRGHVNELKRLIFSPGSSSKVPLIGKKTAIFSSKMREYYDFSIRSERYNGHTEAYVFTVELKPAYEDIMDNSTVIKAVTTFFNKDGFQVLGRSYRLANFTLLYDFDVHMHIELSQIEGQYVPEKIKYEGFWKIPLKKMEKGSFTLRFYDFG